MSNTEAIHIDIETNSIKCYTSYKILLAPITLFYELERKFIPWLNEFGGL